MGSVDEEEFADSLPMMWLQSKPEARGRSFLFCLLRLIGSRPIPKGTGFRTPLEYGVLILKVILKCLSFQLKEFKVNV